MKPRPLSPEEFARLVRAQHEHACRYCGAGWWHLVPAQGPAPALCRCPFCGVPVGEADA